MYVHRCTFVSPSLFLFLPRLLVSFVVVLVVVVVVAAGCAAATAEGPYALAALNFSLINVEYILVLLSNWSSLFSLVSTVSAASPLPSVGVIDVV